MIRLVQILMLSMVFFSCKKSDETYNPVQIKVDLKDDVSPVLAELSIEGEYDLIEWIFENKFSPSEYSPNPAYHVFMTNGLALVKVIAYNNKTKEKFSGHQVVNIPDVAKRLKISGFFIKNYLGPNPFINKTLDIYTGFYNSEIENRMSFSITTSNLDQNDTIFFDQPIILDINGFTEDENSFPLFIINIFENQEPLFMDSFNLRKHYLEVHPWTPDYVQLNNQRIYYVQDLFLVTDWLPN